MPRHRAEPQAASNAMPARERYRDGLSVRTGSHAEPVTSRTAPRFVSYLRVSTTKQGVDGLGIEAQREAVSGYVTRAGGKVLVEYVEAESGRRADRPALAKAIAHARNAGAALLIAKLDRLARNVAFISNLMKSGLEFVAVDMPKVNRLTVHILSAVAEYERDMASKRTAEALAAIKSTIRREGFHVSRKSGRKVRKLGNPNIKSVRNEGNAEAVAMVKAKADDRAKRLAHEVAAVKETGVTSARGIAAALNARGILTPRGKSWDAKTVIRIQERVAALGHQTAA